MICLKPWQSAAIADIGLMKDVVVSAGTGSGKSIIFQCLPYMRSNGIVLIISPLLSIMHDQVCYPSIMCANLYVHAKLS